MCTYCMLSDTQSHSLEYQRECCENIFRRHGQASERKISSVWGGLWCANERTMLPGLSTIMNSRSMSWRRILTGVDVTGGSWRWTTFLKGHHIVCRRCWGLELRHTHSIRSPFLMIVSGFAIFPLIVVTPDSSAYRLSIYHVIRDCWRYIKNAHVVLHRAIPELSRHNLQQFTS